MAPSTTILNTAALTERLELWPLRALWFLSPLVIGFGLGPAIDRFDDPGPIVAEVLLWAAWFIGLIATLAPSTISLTVIRVLAPGLVGIAVIAGIATGDWPLRLGIAIAFGLLVTAVCYLPVVGDRMVNGSAYGSERRMTLRAPGYTLLGPIQLAWLVMFAGAVTGPLLISSGRYVFGAIASVIGVGALWLGWRVLHQLARRWIVFVPAGFVIHDHVVPVESILLQRSIISTLGPATTPLPDGAIDLSGGASGLALEVALNEPVTFGLRVDRTVENTDTDRIVFSPTLPGAVLTEARVRAIKIGTTEASG